MSDSDGAMGAGGAEGPDIAMPPGGDATGGDPGDPDAMGTDEPRTVDDGAGREPAGDPEALGGERQERPDPASSPPPEVTDGATPDADLRQDAGDG